MSTTENAMKHFADYAPSRGNVLLLGCMDLRLLDNTGAFMNHDNLTNRYDHVTIAGTALGVLKGKSPRDLDPNAKSYSYWKDIFFDHLHAAIRLHDVQDVYILEHRNCGAYHKLFGEEDYGDGPDDLVAEKECHRQYSEQLEQLILNWSTANKFPMRVSSFLMDVRGHVELLSSPASNGIKPPKKKSYAEQLASLKPLKSS